MSVAFSSARPRSKSEVTQQAIQKMLDENHQLIQCIMDCQSKGKTVECTQYQQILHRNLVYLATIADSNQNMQSLLPAPPSSNISMDPGRMSQSGGHASSSLNDNMAPYMIQSQMSNVSMMHQQSAPPQHSSANSGRRHYQGQQSMSMMGQTNQGNNTIPQRPMGPYRPSQQDYSYHHSSYGEQGYERSFAALTGNSQYSQQQGSYQQSTGQQQAFSQEQYSSQQGYSGQPQGYGPSQGGPSQFSQYQQSQNQQYGSYHSSQGGPAGQTQRSFTYEQGQYGNLQQ
ncbi:calcium-responsive transactivator-like isoform X7 [Cyprinodon tularosa]|uniref:calcium-responsive transactivator-like isoform X7 n=1 Tax=Cyprinodon tularosa TaxID=77115 RepID=UPI0018E2391B|nr:calcium-responsive transactivator-like isoform X7 [Cyprinodon tularosa]